MPDVILDGLHLTMHRTIRLLGYIRPLGPNPNPSSSPFVC